MRMIDAHAHLTDERFDDLEEVLKRANQTGVTKILCSAFNLLSSQEAVLLSKRFDGIFATVGLHPENVDECGKNDKEKTEAMASLLELSKNDKVVAIGEIGLDYHYCDDNKELQKEFFVGQIDLANQIGLPVVVHSRDAIGDTIEILKIHPPKQESLLHCYSGSAESAEVFMKLGFSFSFGGVVTFSNAKNVVEVVKKLPIERILLETDCPYLAPVPFRGKRNEPKNVVYVADMISKIKGLSLEEVARITT